MAKNIINNWQIFKGIAQWANADAYYFRDCNHASPTSHNCR